MQWFENKNAKLASLLPRQNSYSSNHHTTGVHVLNSRKFLYLLHTLRASFSWCDGLKSHMWRASHADGAYLFLVRAVHSFSPGSFHLQVLEQLCAWTRTAIRCIWTDTFNICCGPTKLLDHDFSWKILHLKKFLCFATFCWEKHAC